MDHFRRPEELPFTAAERPHTTVLIGGLSLRHDALIKAGLEGLGYRIDTVPVPRKADFQAGKEYGNNGQCNPTYFTVGALVNLLKRLRDEEGLSAEEITRRYVFLTAGACGPCRFGMYEAEYRLALKNAGFDGFRVMLFQQEGGLDQATVEAGLDMNLSFFLAMLNGIFIGDLLNEVSYHIRPYEVVPGQTQRVIDRCLALCEDGLRGRGYDQIRGGRVAGLLSKVAPLKGADEAQQFLDQLMGDYYQDLLRRCAAIIDDEIEVDYTRAKPIVKITGEFWAQTTEGDGNFNMFAFLEREGAEVLVEPVVTWLGYLLRQAKVKASDERGLDETQTPLSRFDLRGRLAREARYGKTRLLLEVADRILHREYDRLRRALGGTAHEPVCQLELERLGHPFYNSRSGGGEGHLEVAKNIYYSTQGLAHMVLSLKPFGCMPSTQSDGAQAAVVSRYPDMIYLPIETSGEGDINAHSRVQMALGEAKAKSKTELRETIAKTGYTLEELQSYVAEHRELRRPLLDLPHPEGVAGRAARFYLLVAERMRREAGARRRVRSA
ncbi:MAG: activator of (R)-2-hydroxyglutaryl-CoA dehydratase [Deltaproteobacteria bacterium]|nr:activator of (R)-2-hydroxyglutaryl-CoA dehydratase [Deltaproteobacteria bacterium]